MSFNSELTITAISDKRERSDNWTSREKLFLLDLCAGHTEAIENRKHDAFSAKEKANAWNQIHSAFSLKFGDSRTPQRLKEQWRRLKSMAKLELKNVEGYAENSPNSLGLQLNYMREKINGSQDEEEEVENELRAKMMSAYLYKPTIKVEKNNDVNETSVGNDFSGNASFDYTDDEDRNAIVMQFQPQLPNSGVGGMDDSHPTTSSESTPRVNNFYSNNASEKEERNEFQRREHEQRMAFLDAEHCARMEVLELEKRKAELERDKAEIEKDIAAMKRIKLMNELGINKC